VLFRSKKAQEDQRIATDKVKQLMGRHADLVARNGLYARLCRAQSTTDPGAEIMQVST